MRPLHISTCDLGGGAARSAWNLVQGLRGEGCDARMLVRDKTSNSPHVVQGRSETKRFLERERGASLVQRKLINPNRSRVSNTWFSLPVPGVDVATHEEVAAADLLHLHWVSGYISPGAVKALVQTGKPVVWTLHDQRPFTGGCHFSAGCEGYARACEQCPQLAPDRWNITGIVLAEALRQIDAGRITLVCPSRWMAGCARNSALFRLARTEVVPYGIDTSLFQPGGASLRKKLGIPDSALVLLAGADYSAELRKGLHILPAALRDTVNQGQHPDIRLLVFGASEPPDGFEYPATWLGRLNSEQELADAYTAADAFLLPSTEDNLPNTMLEALCCGTPVIGFAAGGIPDAVEHGTNGVLATDISARGYTDSVALFCRDSALRKRFVREHIATAARERFSLQAQARACLRLYEELVAGAQNNLPRPEGSGGSRSLDAAKESDEFAAAFDGLVSRANKERWKRRWLKLSRRLSMGFNKPGRGRSDG